MRTKILHLGLALAILGCGQTEESSAQVLDHGNIARLVRSLSQSETAGALFWARSILAVGDGNLWVLDTGNHRIVSLDNASDPTAIGREGSGPGEFRNPVVMMRMSGNAVAVWDRSLGRVTVLDTTGEVVSTRLVAPTAPGLGASAVYPAGRGYLALLNQSLSARNPPDGTSHSGLLVRVGEAGAIGDTLVRVPFWGPLVVWEREGNHRRLHAYAPFSDAPAFIDHSLACGGLFVVSVGGRAFDLRFFDGAATPVGSFADSALQGQRVTDEGWEAYLMRWTGQQRRLLERVLERPERHAVVQGLQVTSNGYLFIRLTPRASERTPSRWRVWSLTKSPGGPIRVGAHTDVAFPRGFTPYEMEGETVWGIHLDSLYVPTIRAYTGLELPGGTCPAA